MHLYIIYYIHLRSTLLYFSGALAQFTVDIQFSSRLISNGVNANLVEILLEWNWLEPRDPQLASSLLSFDTYDSPSRVAASSPTLVLTLQTTLWTLSTPYSLYSLVLLLLRCYPILSAFCYLFCVVVTPLDTSELLFSLNT